MAKLTPEHHEYIQNKTNEGYNAREIRDKLAEELDLQMSESHIRKVVAKIKQKAEDTVDKLNDSVEKVRELEIIGDDYIFRLKKTDDYGERYYEEIPVPISLIDEIQEDFSRQGANMTRRAVCEKHGLRIDVANAIKSRLNIYKDSPPISEESMRRAEEAGELEHRIEQSTYRAVHNRYNRLVDEHANKAFLKQANKAIKTVASIDSIIDHINQKIADFEIQGFDAIQVIPENADAYTIAFGDLHIGRSTEYARDSMQKLTNIAVNRPESKIVLACLGDIFEAVGATPHEGQDREMDVYGVDQFDIALDLFSSSITAILEADKEVEFYGIGGNHDRGAKFNHEDQRRVVSHMFYSCLMRSLQNAHLKIEYFRDWIGKFDVNDKRYIIFHGDVPRRTKGKVSDIMREYGKQGEHNITLSGHTHSVELAETLDATHVVVPSMNIGNDYSKKQLLVDAKRGAVGIEENAFGSVNTTVYRFD